MIFILDKSMRVCDTLSNKGENSHIAPFFDDRYTTYLDTGAETYQFSTLADTKESQHLVVGNHIAFQYENEHKLFTITEIEETHDENFIKTVYCEMAGLRLINKVIRPMSFRNTNLRNFVETILEETEWEIGDLDTSLKKTCDIEITDYTNAYSLLVEHVRENYDGEIHFTTKIEGKKATKKINIYAKRGSSKGFRFSYDSNLTSITRTVNLDNLVTALIGVGNNGITFKDVEAEDKPLNQDYLADEEAYLLWSDNGEHILGYEKFDTDSPLELLALTRKKLKERTEPKIRYELKPELLGESVRVGDTVYVVDNEFNPPIYLNARVNELTVSLTDSDSATCVLSNFVEVHSNITDEMKQMGSQLEDYVDSKFPIDTDDIEDGAITEDKLHNGEIIQETHIYADSIDTKHLKAESITTKHLKADIIETGHLKADVITSDKIQANSIETKHLKAEIINAGHINSDSITSKHIQANTIDTHHLKANTIQSGHIQSNSIDTNHLKANIINAGHIQAGSITSGSGIIGDGAIGNAQISSLDAAKIESGTIDTSKVTVQGANGHLRLKGNRIQVFDGIGNQAKERVSVGDVNGDGTVYGLRVRGADGQTILLDENGVTAEGITDGSITNDKISDNAEIDGAKLNINSVINKINEDGSETISGTKIEVDGTNLTTQLYEINIKQDENAEHISQAQSQITANTNAIGLKVDEQVYTADKADMTSKLEKNTSAIDVLKGQIALKVEQTDIENAKNEMGELIDSKIDSAKAEIKVTTDGISQSVSKVETSVTTISGKADTALATATSAENKASQAQTTANAANNTANQAKSEIQQTNTKLASLETNIDGITSSVSAIEDKTTILDGKVNAQETRLATAEQKITPSAITNVVQSANFVKDMNGKINTNASNISKVEQTASSITNRVEALDGKYTEIKQTVDGIDVTGKVSFSDLSTAGRTTIHGGNIKANTLSINSLSSNNPNPIIKLFPTTASDGTSGYCSLDATKQYEQGVGTAIRLKWDSMNYLLQRKSGVEFYMEPREQGASFNFQSDYGHHTSKYESRIITKDGTLCFRRNSNTDESTSSLYFYTGSQNYDRKLLTSYDMSNSVSSTSTSAVATPYAVKQAYDKAVSAYNVGNHSHPYASSSHSHSNYVSTSSSSYFESGSHDPYYTDKYNLGWSSYRWQQLASKYVYATNTYSLAIDNPVATLSDDTLDDVLDDVIIESPNVIRMSDDNGMNEKLVINVNALKQNRNAHLFVGEDDGGKTVVNESSLLALALLEIQKLKEEIKRREELEVKCADLEERLIKLEKILESKL